MHSAVLRARIEAALSHRFPSALTPREKPAPDTLPTRIAAVDALVGGIPRGALTEICGPASSGRTSLLLSLLARLTAAGESCALVDATDAFDPRSAEEAGMDLKRLLWVRCQKPVSSFKFRVSSSRERGDREALSRLEQALKATDLLLQSGGFALVVVDLGDLPASAARRVPLTSWFRFRRAVEDTPTALVVLEPEPYARTCASLVLCCDGKPAAFRSLVSGDAAPAHACLLDGIRVSAEVVRSPAARRPPRSTRAEFYPRLLTG